MSEEITEFHITGSTRVATDDVIRLAGTSNASYGDLMNFNGRSVSVVLSNGRELSGIVESMSISSPTNDLMEATIDIRCQDGETVTVKFNSNNVSWISGFGHSSKKEKLNWKKKIMGEPND